MPRRTQVVQFGFVVVAHVSCFAELVSVTARYSLPNSCTEVSGSLAVVVAVRYTVAPIAAFVRIDEGTLALSVAMRNSPHLAPLPVFLPSVDSGEFLRLLDYGAGSSQLDIGKLCSTFPNHIGTLKGYSYSGSYS